MEEKDVKKTIIKGIVISVIVSTIVSLFACSKIIKGVNGYDLSVKDFQVSDLNISKEDFSYSDPTYTGEAKVYCPKASNEDYIVEYSLKQTAGNNHVGETKYDIIILHNGTGTITTYDYGQTFPSYEIQIIGYRKLATQ